MSKAQTDIRTTSYDALAARPLGYQGTLDDVLTQIRAEDADQDKQYLTARAELLQFLGVDKMVSRARYAEDDSVEYGELSLVVQKPAMLGQDPYAVAGFSIYSLEYAQQRWPENFK